VLLPLADGVEVILGALGLLGSRLGLACGLELPRQGRLRGTGAADKAVTTCLCIVDLDHLLLLCGLAVEDVALLARVGSLALCSDGSRAQRRVGGIAQVSQRHAAVRHGGRDVGRGWDGYCGHA